jgi:HEAT repeat protein
MEKEILFLGLITAVIVIILFVMLIYLIIRKMIDIHNKRLIQQQKEKYESYLYTNLFEGTYTRGLVPSTDIQKAAVEELLSRYGKMLEGDQEKSRLAELAELYLSEYYQKRLKSKKWSNRMNALYNIEDFHLTNLLNDVLLLLKKRSSEEEVVHVLRILSSFQYRHLFEMLTKQYSSFSEYEYRNILIRLEKEPFDQFVLGFKKCQLNLQNAVLEVIGVKKELRYSLFLEKVFLSYSGETKIRALKALAELGYVKHIDRYLDLLVSPKWEERMISAKLFGALQETSCIPQLINLLHDQIWWVRSQAGQAIARFPNGKQILQNVFETSKDPFAKDMAWEWLHKGV